MDFQWYGTLGRESNKNITQVGVNPMGGTSESSGEFMKDRYD